MNNKTHYKEKMWIYEEFIDFFLFSDSIAAMKENLVKILNNFPDFHILCEKFHLSPELISKILNDDWNISAEELMNILIGIRKSCQIKLSKKTT